VSAQAKADVKRFWQIASQTPCWQWFVAKEIRPWQTSCKASIYGQNLLTLGKLGKYNERLQL